MSFRDFIYGAMVTAYIMAFILEGQKDNFSLESTALGLAVGILFILFAFYINWSFPNDVAEDRRADRYINH